MVRSSDQRLTRLTFRKLDSDSDPKLGTVYFLTQKRGTQRIQVINLKQLIKEKFGLEFSS